MIGMVLGNVLKGIQLGLDTACLEYTAHRDKVEMYIARGASKWEAGSPVIVLAARAGMMPTINFMSIMGLVSIPGMMTGQIMGGADPLLAAKYQIVIIYLICTATAVGTFISLLLLQQIIFDQEGRLLVERLIRRGKKGGDIVTEIMMLLKRIFLAIFNWCLYPCCRVFFWCCFRQEDYGYDKLPYSDGKYISLDYKDQNGFDLSDSKFSPREQSTIGGLGTASAGLHWMSSSFARSLPITNGIPPSPSHYSTSSLVSTGSNDKNLPTFPSSPSLIPSPTTVGNNTGNENGTSLGLTSSSSSTSGFPHINSFLASPSFGNGTIPSTGSTGTQQKGRGRSSTN